jgi:hypothetical protein
LFAAAYGFDVSHTTDVTSLTVRDAGAPQLLRWSLLLDMLGYLTFGAVVLFIGGRLRAVSAGSELRSWMANVATSGGLLFALVGAVAAALMAAAAPPLVELAASGGSNSGAAALTFGALANGTFGGLWGPLEWLGAAAWVGMFGKLVINEGRAFAYLAIAAGVGAAAYALRTGATGTNPVETAEPIDVAAFAGVAVFYLAEVWLAARLWRGR